MPPNLQSQIPDLMSTMPLKAGSNTASELNDYDTKNSLRSRPPQELVPIPFRSMNMGGGMFSTNAGALFGGPKSMSPSSSSLQLSSNNTSSSGFSYLQDSKTGGLISGSAQMSATALLQKAAQMGATASNSGVNSPMMQKGFVGSMAGPDQVSSTRLPYPGSIMQHNNHNSYDHFPSPQHDLSSMAGVSGAGAFTNQLFQKGPQEISQLFDNNNTNGSTMNDIGMFSQMSMGLGSDHNQVGVMKNVEQEVGLIHARDVAESNPMEPPKFGGNDMTMVHDFLGIGGSSTSRAAAILHEPQQHQQQQRFEAFSHQRLESMNHFHHHLPHEDSAMEKHIWDV